MPYVTRFDRRGKIRMAEAALDTMSDEEALGVFPVLAEFHRRGILRIIKTMLRTKFGEEAMDLVPAIEQMDDGEKYLALGGTIITAATLDEVRRACAKLGAPATRRKKTGNGKRGSSRS